MSYQGLQRALVSNDDRLAKRVKPDLDALRAAGEHRGQWLSSVHPVARLDRNHEPHRWIDGILHGPTAAAQLQDGPADSPWLDLRHDPVSRSLEHLHLAGLRQALEIVNHLRISALG